MGGGTRYLKKEHARKCAFLASHNHTDIRNIFSKMSGRIKNITGKSGMEKPSGYRRFVRRTIWIADDLFHFLSLCIKSPYMRVRVRKTKVSAIGKTMTRYRNTLCRFQIGLVTAWHRVSLRNYVWYVSCHSV